MLEKDNTVLVVIDVQGKLAQLMHEKDALFADLAKLVKGAKVLGIPVICTEQNPEGLGATIAPIAELIDGQPIGKFSFSCCGEPLFVRELQRSSRRQVLLSGIETHICVYQTATGLLAAGYDVHVVADAVSSRSKGDKEIGLRKMMDAGAAITSVETALFELLRVAKGEQFKAILGIVK